jgi:AraC-like DNA-binding protein/CheY-like chemotaxis protein
MVSTRCKIAVKEELTKLGLHFNIIGLGEVDVMEDISGKYREQLRIGLSNIGLELMDDSRAILIEKIKNIVIESVHHSTASVKINFSHYLSDKLNHDYPYLASLFSEVQGTTIEQFLISHKIEKAKELLTYGELTITQIAFRLKYSSVAHLSSQFKKVVGISPSQFLKLKNIRRKPLEEIGKYPDGNSLEMLNGAREKNKIKLFLVDDDPIFLKLLELQFLEHGGFIIKTFTTGELCIASLSEDPHIIILDYHLNSVVKTAMTGLETLDKIKYLDDKIPAIMLSSQDKIEVAVDCLHHKAVDYVVKNETAFLRLKKIITTILTYNKMEKQLNWFEDRM